MRRVLVCEEMDAAGLELLAQRVEVDHRPGLWSDPAALRQGARDAEALIVRNRTRVDRALVEASVRLRVVGRLGVGLDNIDAEALAERGVALVVPRGVNAASVAEYVLAAMLTVSRDLAGAWAAVREGRWDRERFVGQELSGKTLGIVGMGAVGRRLALRARAMGMNLLASDPRADLAELPLAESAVTLLDLDELLSRSDFVSLHCPLTPATRRLLDARRIARLGPDAVLINAARGALVDEAALFDALSNGRLRFAVLDVREVEPPAVPDPLARLDNVLLTPHVAGSTREAFRRAGLRVARGVLTALDAPPGP